jgi:hypothetical protein
VTYGGDSGNRIFVLYGRCPLIRVFVIRGSNVIITAIQLRKGTIALFVFVRHFLSSHATA